MDVFHTIPVYENLKWCLFMRFSQEHSTNDSTIYFNKLNYIMLKMLPGF